MGKNIKDRVRWADTVRVCNSPSNVKESWEIVIQPLQNARQFEFERLSYNQKTSLCIIVPNSAYISEAFHPPGTEMLCMRLSLEVLIYFLENLYKCICIFHHIAALWWHCSMEYIHKDRDLCIQHLQYFARWWPGVAIIQGISCGLI